MMANPVMLERLRQRAALDVGVEGESIAEGVWRLHRFVEGVDYCDAQRDRWIWSIGRALEVVPVKNGNVSALMPGTIVASIGSELYQHPSFERLFLR